MRPARDGDTDKSPIMALFAMHHPRLYVVVYDTLLEIFAREAAWERENKRATSFAASLYARGCTWHDVSREQGGPQAPIDVATFLLFLSSYSCKFTASIMSTEPGSFTSNGSMIVVSNRLPFVLKRNESTGQLERKARLVWLLLF